MRFARVCGVGVLSGRMRQPTRRAEQGGAHIARNGARRAARARLEHSPSAAAPPSSSALRRSWVVESVDGVKVVASGVVTLAMRARWWRLKGAKTMCVSSSSRSRARNTRFSTQKSAPATALTGSAALETTVTDLCLLPLVADSRFAPCWRSIVPIVERLPCARLPLPLPLLLLRTGQCLVLCVSSKSSCPNVARCKNVFTGLKA